MFATWVWIVMYALICLFWVVGILGNILSAIVWRRRQVATKNSSAVYLAALAINDLVYLLSPLLFPLFQPFGRLFYLMPVILFEASFTLEPLFVLGFSIERLIAIRHPLQVCTLWTFIMPPVLQNILNICYSYGRDRPKCILFNPKNLYNALM